MTDAGSHGDLTALSALAARVVELVSAEDSSSDEHIEANVLVARRRHGLTRFANSFIHQHVADDVITIHLTLAVDGRSTASTTTAVDEDALRRLVTDAIASARLQPVDPTWPGATPPQQDHSDAVGTRASEAEPSTQRIDDATAHGDPGIRAECVADFIGHHEDSLAAGYVDTEATWAAFASTEGHHVQGASTRATLDGIHRIGRAAGSAHQTARRVNDIDGRATGERALDTARRAMDPVDIEPGVFEVVLGPEAVASILLFLSVYGFNGKSHLDGASFVRIGELQLDPAITLLDDPTDPRSMGIGFDAEGVPHRQLALVDRGVSTAVAHDRRTAKRASTTSTGNAVPGGASFGAVGLNLVLRAGTTSPAAMVADVEDGLYVTQFHYCRVLDPKSLIVTGLTRNGTFRIRDGELSDAVGDLRFTQSFVEGLAPGNVRAVGDDDRFADAEFGPGMAICPSLRLAAWRFTGGSKG